MLAFLFIQTNVYLSYVLASSEIVEAVARASTTLATIFYNATKDRIRYIFGDSIKGLKNLRCCRGAIRR